MKMSIDKKFRYLVTTLCITCIETGDGFYNSFLCDSLDEVKDYLKKTIDHEALTDVYDLFTGEKLNL